MKHNWEKKKLDKVLAKSALLETPIPFQNYKQVGIQLWGKGTYAREDIDGGNTGYKFFNKLMSGDLVINKIWARNGATSVVPEEFNGYYVSTEYPVFHIDKNILEPTWMLYVTQQKWFWNACNEQSFGTSGKNRIRPEKILAIEIPIPPLPEQKRIVLKIQSIKNKLDQINEIRENQSTDINNLLFSKYTELIKSTNWLPMSEVAPIIRREVELNDEKFYPELGIRCFGKGTFHKPALTGLEVATKKIFQIKTGDLVFSNVFAWEGGIAVAKAEDNNRYGSHRFISCVVDKEKILAEFLCFHFLSPKGLEDINACSPGGAGRNKTLGLDKLMNIKVPVSDINLQNEFVKLLHKVNAIKEHRKHTEKELIELMPSLLDMAFKGEL
jgi:type I restriction enzyme, S subunit